MKRQSTGVVPFKHLIKWMYPEAVGAFDPCAAIHDADYKNVDWSKGSEATAAIDAKFLYCCQEAAGHNQKLCEQAWLFYDVARAWGKMRAVLWKLGLRY